MFDDVSATLDFMRDSRYNDKLIVTRYLQRIRAARDKYKRLYAWACNIG